MVATVIIREWTSSASATDKTSSTVRFKNANNPTVDSNDPLVIPSPSGTDYSFEKWLRLRITGTPPSDKIDNLNFYMDGTNNYGTGVYLWGTNSSKLALAVGEPNTANRPPHVQTASGSHTTTDAFSFTSGAPLQLGPAADAFSASSTDVGHFAVLVLEASAAATQGTLTAETATFEYDEI